ncbi:MAG: O-antigen ligase family protein, partial [Thermodesulfovibrionales bacterium]|nr:O-antigen ligase family protein [Thermodesulfovibrionales bacterium]
RNARQYITEYFSNFRSTLTSLILVAVGLMALGISFSNSRMGAISIMASLLLMLTVLSISGKKKKAMLLVAVLLAVSFTVGMFGTGHLEGRFEEAWSTLRDTRGVLWNSTLELSKDYPLVGSGLGTYRAAFQLYTPVGWTSITKQAHNDYLEMLSETGVAGSAVALIALTYYLFLFSIRWREGIGGRRATVSLGAFCAVFYILVFSLTDFNLQIPSNAFLFSLAMALSLAWPSTAPDTNRLKIAGAYRQGIRRAVASGLLLLLLPACFLSVQQWRAERLFPVEKTFIRAGEAAEITSHAEARMALSASTLFPGNETYHILLGQYHEHEARVPGTIESKRLEQLDMAIDEFITALEMNPASLNALGHLAWSEFSKGDFLSATRRLDAALDIAPTNYLSHLFYAQAVTGFINAYPKSMRRPYLYKASREFERGVEMNPSFLRSSQVLVNMAGAFMKLGNKEEALKRLDMIRDYAPWTLPHIVKAARIHLDSGRPREGVHRYRRMYRYNFKDNASRRNIAEHLEEDVNSRPELHELRALLIELMLDQKDWDGAIRMMQGELGKGIRPDSTIYYEMGLAYEKSGEVDDASDMYIKAVTMDKRNRDASRRLAKLLKEGLRKDLYR